MLELQDEMLLLAPMLRLELTSHADKHIYRPVIAETHALGHWPRPKGTEPVTAEAEYFERWAKCRPHTFCWGFTL